MQRTRILKQISNNSRTDMWVGFFAIVLALFGLLMVFESSNVSAYSDFGDKYHYVKDQFRGLVVGLTGMGIASFIPYKKYYQWSLPFLIITIITLFTVFVPGIGVNAYGASRWINLGFMNFQPTEMAKLSLVLYLSAWLSEKEKGKLLPFLMLLGLIIGLVMLQPDMGTAIILTSIAIIMYYLSGANIMHFVALIPSLILGVVFLAISSPYRLKRLMTFLNPSQDPLGSSYHIRQILIALGTGGLTGVGLGSSLQKYQYLPEATTDSIFAIIGEEFGFLGSLALIMVFIFFLLRILKIIKNTHDPYSYLLGSGILVYFGCQIAVNLGAIVAILPLTGVPLPFISFGSSNLVISLAAVGILINISKSSSKNHKLYG